MHEPILYKFIRPILTFLFKIVFHPHIIGSENIPAKGKIILAGNHTNILDCVLLLACTKRTVHFLAKDELVKGPLGFIFKRLGIIPVNRREKDKNAIPTAVKYLNEEKPIGIFPEGTINKTNDVVMPFKMGAIKIANESESLIIPFAITGKYKIFGKGVTINFNIPYYVGNDLKEENEKLSSIVKHMILERR